MRDLRTDVVAPKASKRHRKRLGETLPTVDTSKAPLEQSQENSPWSQRTVLLPLRMIPVNLGCDVATAAADPFPLPRDHRHHQRSR